MTRFMVAFAIRGVVERFVVQARDVDNAMALTKAEYPELTKFLLIRPAKPYERPGQSQKQNNNQPA